MKRRSLTTKARLELFTEHHGECHICGGKIHAGEKWEVEHLIPIAMGGDDEAHNMRPAHVKCHRAKTSADVKAIAKAKRMEAKHLGIRPRKGRPMPGSVASGIRRKFNGDVTKW